jgi:hypothetical protein
VGWARAPSLGAPRNLTAPMRTPEHYIAELESSADDRMIGFGPA